MKLSVRWVLLVAFGAGALGYLLGGGDEEPSETPPTVVRSDELPRAAGVPGRQATTYGRQRYVSPGLEPDLSGDWAAPADRAQAAPQRGSYYGFRPPESSDRVPEGYRTDQPPAWRDGAAYPYEPREAERRAEAWDRTRPPADSYYRFRPLEEGERERRWRPGYQQMSAPPVQLARPLRVGRIATR